MVSSTVLIVTREMLGDQNSEFFRLSPSIRDLILQEWKSRHNPPCMEVVIYKNTGGVTTFHPVVTKTWGDYARSEDFQWLREYVLSLAASNSTS